MFQLWRLNPAVELFNMLTDVCRLRHQVVGVGDLIQFLFKCQGRPRSLVPVSIQTTSNEGFEFRGNLGRRRDGRHDAANHCLQKLSGCLTREKLFAADHFKQKNTDIVQVAAEVERRTHQLLR